MFENIKKKLYQTIFLKALNDYRACYTYTGANTEKVLDYLIDNQDREIPAYEFIYILGITRYGDNIYKLRKKGHIIQETEIKRATPRDKRKTFYKYIGMQGKQE